MMDKRRFLAAVGSMGALVAGLPARAQSREFTEAFAQLTAGRAPREGRVRIEIARLADNGNSVPVKVHFDGPLAEGSHVSGITLLSDRNPRPVIAKFRFGPRAGHPVLSTRVRLNGSQHVVAVAELSDGSLWSAEAPVEVTESACLDAT